MFNSKMKAFTLVELIVVITILAILGTIAFISLQGYSKTSRDSVRIADISNIESSFELFHIGSSKYPETTSGTTIKYLGYEAWTQGIVGKTTINNLDKLDRIPKDPLTYKEYSYSLTSNKQEYQLAGILELDGFSFNNILLNEGYAEGTVSGQAFVIGNFNGKILQVKGGGKLHILAVPSIVSSDISDTNLVNIINAEKLIYNHFKNLPNNYEGSKYIVEGETNLLLTNADKIEVFSGVIEDLKNEENQIILIKALQEAYSGTIINSEYVIEEILAYNTEANPEGTKFLSQTIINNNITDTVLITADNVNYTYQCDILLGDAESHPDFNLCNNIKLNSINNISDSSNLTNHSGNRDVYTFELEGGKEYVFETLGDDSQSDTRMYLYNKDGNKLIVNEDISNDIWRSKFTYNVPYTGYYYIGIMGYQDGGTLADYTLNIKKTISCAVQPNYTNTNFLEGGNLIEGKAWQNTDETKGCYYQCINGYIGEDCSEASSCLSDLTETDKNTLNTFFNGTIYNGDISYWCGIQIIDGYDYGLTGSIPPELGDLINLKELLLGDNTGMSGSIPPELGNLINLEFLYLRQMGLTGPIPNSLFNLTKLEYLYMNWNDFTGPISPLFGNLINLKTIRLSDSHFTGNIPQELGNLINLTTLGLKGNNLTGIVPGELGNLTKLGLNSGQFYLNNNELTGAEQGFCDLIKDGTRNWNSPDSSTNNNDYGEYRDNPQDTDSDGNYDNTINLCP